MVSILFFISAAKYPTLIKPNNIGVFQFIYFFSSFWGQVLLPSSCCVPARLSSPCLWPRADHSWSLY
jgi:hypothetical protein